MAKKYYWLKLKEDFFTQPKIKKLRKIAGGDTYTIIYLKLQLLSLTNNGILEYEGIESTFENELALKLDEEIEDVKLTIAYLKSQELIEEKDTEFMLLEATKNIGSETDSAERVRRFRQKQIEQKNEEKTLLGNDSVTECNKTLISNSYLSNSSSNNSSNNKLNNNKKIKEINKDIKYIEQDIKKIVDTFRELYKQYGYSHRFARTNTTKKIKSILKSPKKDKRLYPMQIYLAYKLYLHENYEEGTKVQFIKNSDTFLTSQVYDYTERIQKRFEKEMQAKYGEDWKKIKFEYKE